MKESEGKEAFRKPVLILGLSFVALGCTLGFSSLAWFASPATSADVSGLAGEATGSYFSPVDGQTIADGSKEHPFGIQNAQQLYYFAWLQDMGYFNKDVKGKTDDSGNDIGDGEVDTQYYFELMNDIDATGKILPPCGIEKYPFVGNFDAKNYTISNLTISNALSTSEGDGYIEKYPLSTTSSLTIEEFGNQAGIVGFFGIIGGWDGKSSSYATLKYDSTINEVKNLYLDNITIKTKKDNLLVGIFAGYVNGVIDNCGVHYAKMSINGATSNLSKFSNVSRFTLIGDYNTTDYSYAQDQDSGSSDSGDEGYGTSIDVYSLYNKLSESMGSTDNPISIPTNCAIPIKFDSSKSITTGSGTTTVTSSGKSISANNASTIAVDSNATNIGYYSGALGVYKDIFSGKDASTIKDAGNTPVSYSDLTDAEKTKIQNYLTKATTTGKNSDNAIILNGSPQFNGTGSSRAQAFPTSASAYTVIQNAKIGAKTFNAFVPANGIWVAPVKPGRFEFVASAISTASGEDPIINTVVLIVRLARSSHLDYSSGFDNTSYLCEFTNKWTTGMVGFVMSAKKSTIGYYYYGLDITQDDITNGYEYFITSDAGMPGSTYGYPAITYLDIGTDGSSSGDSGDTKTVITNFDFVTKDSSGSLTKIKSYNETSKTYEKNDDYQFSEVTFKIGSTTGEGDTNTTTLGFRRLNDTVGVYYFQSAAVLTPSTGGTKTPTTKEDCTSA